MTEPQTKAGREFLDEWGPPTVRELVRPGILAIEAEAVAPWRKFAQAITEYGVHFGNCPYESWNKRTTKCKCGLFALIAEARALLTTTPEKP